MNTSDRINLGILVVTALGLASGAAYAVYRWLRGRYFSVRMALGTARHERLYIAAVRMRRDLPPTISRLAAWCRLRFWNVGPEARLITELFTQEDDGPPRKLVGPLASQMRFGYVEDTPTGIVALPLTLEPQHGIYLWGLVAIDVPEDLGEILFTLYGGQARTLPSFQHWDGRLPEAEKYILEGVDGAELGIKDVSIKLSTAEMTYPILQQRGEELGFEPRLGFVPPHVTHRQVKEIAQKMGWRPDEILRKRAKSYCVHARLGNGQVLRQTLKIGQDSLWWTASFGDDADRTGVETT